jgi:hypothetical protein
VMNGKQREYQESNCRDNIVTGRKARPNTELISTARGKNGMTILLNSFEEVPMWHIDLLLGNGLNVSKYVRPLLGSGP